jgi:hypothetical protein
MSQKIVTLCDAHQLHDEEVPGAAWEVTLRAPGEAKATTWTVDLCEDDGKSLEDLATMLNAVGRVTDGPRRKMATAARKAARTDAQARTAPTAHEATRAPNRGLNTAVPANETAEGFPCPVDGCGKVPATRKALMLHLRHSHDGMSLAEAMGAPLPYECPDCDRAFSHVQGLGAHRRSAHGVRPHEAAGASGAA